MSAPDPAVIARAIARSLLSADPIEVGGDEFEIDSVDTGKNDGTIEVEATGPESIAGPSVLYFTVLVHQAEVHL